MPEPTGDQTILSDNPPATTQVDWKESIPTEYRESVSKFQDVGTMAKSYVEMEKMMGSRVKVPDETTPAEERSAFYQKLGRPQTPEGYDLGLSEETPVNPEIVNSIQKAAFEAGVSQTQLQSVVKSYMDAETAALNQTFTEGETALKTLWKENYEPNIKIGQRALKELSGEEYRDELVALVDGTPLGNSPVFIRFLNDIGNKMLPDTLITGKQVAGEEDYEPQYPNSPSMYKDDDTDEGKRARAWHEARGYVYS
jgi:hypothetical protein